MREVVIDTDYFNFITMDCTNQKVFLEVMKELEVMPVMHEFVYKQELHECSFVKELKENGNIRVLEYSEFLPDSNTRKQYEKLAKYAYGEMNGKAFDEKRDFFNYHHEKENLGEIHSVTMARLLKKDIFMSNDGGAKNFVETKLNSNKHQIRVMNIEDTFEELLKNQETQLSWGEVKKVVKQYKNNGNWTDIKKYEKIKAMWKKVN